MPKYSVRSVTGLLLSLVLFFCAVVPLSFAQKTVHVRTYTRKDGTVVAAHERSAPHSRGSSTSSSGSTPAHASGPIYTPIYTSGSSATRSRCVTCERDKNGKIKRSASAKHAFMQMHPCPINGATSGKCPGYVIDHVQALAEGGADDPSNMQWENKEAAKAKDKTERKH